jgi:hypothetical protein
VHDFLVIDEENAFGHGWGHFIISRVRRAAPRSGRETLPERGGHLLLPYFFLVAILSQPLFAFVRGDLTAFSFLTAGHVRFTSFFHSDAS